MPHIDADDRRSNPSAELTLDSIIRRRMTRRGFLAGTAGAGLLAALPRWPVPPAAFTELENRISDRHHVPDDHAAQVLIRWGDAVLADAPAFSLGDLRAEAQERQFGYNNDFVAFLPLPLGSTRSDHGLLCVNHEYTNAHLMWSRTKDGLSLDREQIGVEMAAHGHSIVEIKLEDGRWSRVMPSQFNRRLTARTPMWLSGPVAGDARVKTKADPTGRRVLGTINNCAGGVTPWGTVLIAEENFNYYFAGDPRTSKEARNHLRYGLGIISYAWGRIDPRFDLQQEPKEPNRFGWIVEYDPYDPTWTPRKRTALGRVKHEGATVVTLKDGRIALYTGDDQVFEYVYRFVSHGRVDVADRRANQHLLDDGVLSVAQFDADGNVRWIPLVFGTGPLTPDNGFHSQADVLIETRRAADLLRATPMDRPEDVETNSVTGAVYVLLTNNATRTSAQVHPSNPRPANHHGHILELVPPTRDGAPDHAALTYRWSVFLRGGNPSVPADGAQYHPDVTANGWLSCPDNCAFDARGRLWIATDQGSIQQTNGIPDGLRVCETQGPHRALTRLFFAGPRGSETCGPCFTPDHSTLFVAIQHPGEGFNADRSVSTFDTPSTRWPDFEDSVPPRPSIVAIRKKDGGPVG